MVGDAHLRIRDSPQAKRERPRLVFAFIVAIGPKGAFAFRRNDTINTMPTKRPTHARPSATSQRSARKRGSASRDFTPHARVRTRKNRPGKAAHATFSQTPTMRSGNGGGAPGMHIPTPGGGSVLITRRQLLYGAAGLGALAAVAGGAGALVSSLGKSDEVAPNTLAVPESAVTPNTDFETLESAESLLQVAGDFKLPYGSLVWANDPSIAACLIPTETGSPLSQIGLLALSSGSLSTVTKQAVGTSEGFEIYDVRACSSGVVWTEANILSGTWRIYGAASDGSSVSQPSLLEEGDADWETPTLAATSGYAFWQVLPQASGAKRTEKSRLMRASFAGGSPEVVYESNGRMASAPYALEDSVVITPRAASSATRYQLTRIDARTGSVLDTMVLPSNMKPYEAGYGKTGFMFSFDAIYSYGDGIANLGTYVPLQAVSADASSFGNPAYSEAAWFRYAKNPTAAPAWCNNLLIAKGDYAVVAFDLEKRQVAQLDVPSGADSYGDYLASTGMGSTFVTFTNVDYQPIGGDAQKLCRVRVWQPVG